MPLAENLRPKEKLSLKRIVAESTIAAAGIA